MAQRNKSTGFETEVKDTSSSALDLPGEAIAAISDALRHVLADVFAIYLKTKNFHWHIGGPHFRDYHLLLDEQAAELYDITDELAERARKIGGTTLRSIGDITRHQSIKDNDDEFVAARDMLVELGQDNRRLARSLRAAHELCAEHNDVATTSLIETWIDQAERRVWFLSQSTRDR